MIGSLTIDSRLRVVAESFRVPVLTSADGKDYAQDFSFNTMFVLDNFEGDIYNYLYKQKQSILGHIALQQLANKNELLPDNTRPLFNLAMTGVVVCFTGFRNKDVLVRFQYLILFYAFLLIYTKMKNSKFVIN